MKKKITSIILSLSLAFNIASVGVYADDTLVSDDNFEVVADNTDVSDIDDEKDENEIEIDGGLVIFPSDFFDTSEINQGDKVAQIKFEGNNQAFECDLFMVDASTAEFSDELELTEDVEYTINLLEYDGYTTGYNITETFTATEQYDETQVQFQAESQIVDNDEEVTVSGVVTFVSAEVSDLKDKTPKLKFLTDAADEVIADLEIKNTREGHYSVKLTKDTKYNISLINISSYELADYNENIELTVETSELEINFDAIKTVNNDKDDNDKDDNDKDDNDKDDNDKDDNDKDDNDKDDNYKDDNDKDDEQVSPESDEEGELETPDEEESTGDLEIPQAQDDETFGDNTLTNIKVEGLAENVTATISPIVKEQSTVLDYVVINRKDTSNQIVDGKEELITVEYSSPLTMFDFSVDDNYNNEELTITIDFEPIPLSDKGDADETFLRLFHFNSNNEADIVSSATFTTNENGEYISVTFTTNDFSPFAIAQGYSTVKITNSGSSSSTGSEGSTSSSSSNSGTVTAVGSDGTKYYVTGNIPTIGFISELRGVSVGEVLNLDKITISNKKIVAWYYDREFTKKVDKTNAFEVTQSVMDNGVYPQFEVEVGVLAAELVIDNNGDILSSTVDVAATTTNNTSNTINNSTEYVPTTGVALGARLF